MSKTLNEIIDQMSQQQRREFALDCAEHVLYIFEGEYPNDLRMQNVIGLARLYAAGKVDADTVEAARYAAMPPLGSHEWRIPSSWVVQAVNTASSTSQGLFTAYAAAWAAHEARRAQHAQSDPDSVGQEYRWQKQRAIEILGGAVHE